MADEPSNSGTTDSHSPQSNPEDGNWRWGMTAIALSLLPVPLAMSVGMDRISEIGLVCWPFGLVVGLLGLWEAGSARKVALVGLLMNIVVPLIGTLLWPLFVGFMLSRAH